MRRSSSRFLQFHHRRRHTWLLLLLLVVPFGARLDFVFGIGVDRACVKGFSEDHRVSAEACGGGLTQCEPKPSYNLSRSCCSLRRRASLSSSSSCRVFLGGLQGLSASSSAV